MKRVVVGVDGSEASLRALTKAIEYAQLLGAEVDAVMAWHVSYGTTEFAVLPMIPREDVEAGTRESLATAVAAQSSPVPVNQVVLEGDPARVLIELSQGADLVVLGTRGHGGFAGLLLGSVTQKVIHHANCPVLVVPLAAAPD